ncbi:YALI0B22858p [Anopheles sinensis]|uniref:YALI0B22858p n=1 Tax=Anopheles sinensis TaxID=74873 RepID=A0A084WJA0_ANOSI|nr:YALI0B22858p [Anopheles sinensis]
MWLLWIALLMFTAELTFSDATVYGSVNDSPEDTDQPSASGSSAGLRLLSQPSPLDFVDTGGRFGSRENTDDSSKETDLFSQLKHLQLPARGHQYTSTHEFKPASDSEMANVRRSLATVLQVLLPYGRLQQSPSSHDHADDHPPPFGDDSATDFSNGSPLLPDGPDTANYMLHGKLVEIGPRRYGAAHSSLADPAAEATLRAVGQKRAAALRSTVARRSHAVPAGRGNGEDGSFLPSISVDSNRKWNT